MTLNFTESFAHLTNAQLARKWNVTQGGSIVAGPYGAGSAGWAGTNTDYLQVTHVPAVTRIVHARVKIAAGAVRNSPILCFMDTAAMQVTVSVDVDGTVCAFRGAVNGTLLARSSAALKTGVWYSFDVKATIDPAAGAVGVKIDGAQILTVAGVNTRATANTSTNGSRLGSDYQTSGVGVSTTVTYADVAIADTAGARNNDYLGDCRVACILPTAAGFYTEYTTLVGAATHWQAVAENPADDDTSYVASATAAQRDTFATADLPTTTGTVLAVVVNHTSRKDDAGVRTVAGMARSAGVDLVGAVGANLAAAYAVYQEILETDPAAASWTIATVNGAEFGVRELA